MLARQIFPITSGWVVSKIDAALKTSLRPEAANALVTQRRPDTFPERLVTVRDDSGPQDGTQSRRRYGVNVWATDSVSAENLANLCMAVLRVSADGNPVTATNQFSGPFEVTDEAQATANNKNLYHFYFTFRLTVRSSNF